MTLAQQESAKPGTLDQEKAQKELLDTRKRELLLATLELNAANVREMYKSCCANLNEALTSLQNAVDIATERVQKQQMNFLRTYAAGKPDPSSFNEGNLLEERWVDDLVSNAAREFVDAWQGSGNLHEILLNIRQSLLFLADIDTYKDPEQTVEKEIESSVNILRITLDRFSDWMRDFAQAETELILRISNQHVKLIEGDYERISTLKVRLAGLVFETIQDGFGVRIDNEAAALPSVIEESKRIVQSLEVQVMTIKTLGQVLNSD